jgi:hypothetical protein
MHAWSAEDRVMAEPFRRGELVTLRQYDSPAEPLGRIVTVSPTGESVEVSWHRREGHDRQVTRESTTLLRRVHESEVNPQEGASRSDA